MSATPREPYDVQAAARRLVEQSTKAQGLPEQITDPEVLNRVAAIVESARADQARKEAS